MHTTRRVRLAVLAAGAVPLFSIAAPRYHYVDLTPQVTANAAPYALTDAGVAAGSCTYCGATGYFAARFRDGTDKVFEPFGDARDNAVLGIDAHNTMVGYGSIAGDGFFPRAFQLHDGVVTRLFTGEASSAARGIDRDGSQIVGYLVQVKDHASQAFVMRNGVVQMLAPLGGSYTDAYAVRKDWIVGVSSIADFTYRPFVYHAGVMTQLEGLGGSNNWPTANLPHAVNAKGVAVGECNAASGSHACSWHDGITEDLGTLGQAGDKNVAIAYGINDHGVVVGLSTRPNLPENQHVAWVKLPDGPMIDLNTLVVDLPPGVRLQSATAINASGQITGSTWSVDNYGAPDHAYLLTPIDAE
jgi:uncharacterized membrane protein